MSDNSMCRLKGEDFRFHFSHFKRCFRWTNDILFAHQILSSCDLGAGVLVYVVVNFATSDYQSFFFFSIEG